MNNDLIIAPIKALIFYLQGAEDTEKDSRTARVYNLLSFRLNEILDLFDKENNLQEKQPIVEPQVNIYERPKPKSSKKKNKADIIIKKEDELSLEDIINRIPSDRTKSRLKILQSLNNVGITNLIELIQESSSHIGSIKGIGPKRLKQLIEALMSHGYILND